MAQDRKDLRFAVSCHLHLNLLVYLAEKILLPQPLTFGGDYHITHSITPAGQSDRTLTEQRKSRKERRTAKQMHADLVQLGFDGSYERVAAFVREWKGERQRAGQ